LAKGTRKEEGGEGEREREREENTNDLNYKALQSITDESQWLRVVYPAQSRILPPHLFCSSKSLLWPSYSYLKAISKMISS
jgi:hypothetical protein